jgi:hypothetical protein
MKVTARDIGGALLVFALIFLLAILAGVLQD